MKTIQLGSKQFMLSMTTLFVLFLGIMATGCSGGGDGDSSTGSTGSTDTVIEAPGAPTNFLVVTSYSGGQPSAILAWEAPTTGGEPTSYEIYRNETGENLFDPVNHLHSLPATTFEFIDDDIDKAGGADKTYYWIVAAKNAGGETPASPEAYSGYGNNFAAAVIFAEGYGLKGEKIDGDWTKNVTDIDYGTGLRPVSEDNVSELPENVTELPYFDESTTYELNGATYYKQQTASTWQGEWQNGSGTETEHNVTAKWGDNLISQTLNSDSIVRVEMVLTKALDENMTSYNMVSLRGTKDVELYGTDGKEYNNSTAFVFTTNARLRIDEVDDNGTIIRADLVNQSLLDPSIHDGPGNFGAETTMAGNIAYGYVWDLKNDNDNITPGIYRITFLLDPTVDLPNGDTVTLNTSIGNIVFSDDEGDATNPPKRVSATEVYIDIIIHE